MDYSENPSLNILGQALGLRPSPDGKTPQIRLVSIDFERVSCERWYPARTATFQDGRRIRFQGCGSPRNRISECGVTVVDNGALVQLAGARDVPLEEFLHHTMRTARPYHFLAKELGAYWPMYGKNLHRPKTLPERFEYGVTYVANERDLPGWLKSHLQTDSGVKTYLVLHAGMNEARDLAALGINLGEVGVESRIIDTQRIDAYLRKDNSRGSLFKICARLRIDAQNMHNGGNDAYLTMQVALRFAILTEQQREQYGKMDGVTWDSPLSFDGPDQTEDIPPALSPGVMQLTGDVATVKLDEVLDRPKRRRHTKRWVRLEL